MDQKDQLINFINDSSQKVIRSTKRQIFQTLGFEYNSLLSNRNESNKFLNFIEEQITEFETIKQLKKFFNMLQETIEEEFRNVFVIDEDLNTIEERLNNRFQNLLRISIVNLDEDFKYLAHKTVRTFPTVSFEQIDSILKSKKGKITNIINDAHKDSIDSITKTIPNLAKLIKKYNIAKNNAERIVEVAKSKLKEVQKKFYGADSKYIRESIRQENQFTKFQKEIKSGVYNSLLSRKMSDLEIEQFIDGHLPGLNNALSIELPPITEEKKGGLTNHSNRQPLENKPVVTNREQELENFTEYLLKEILEELNAFDPKVLNTYNFTLKETFIVEAAVESVGYLSPEELQKITTRANNTIQSYLNNITKDKPVSF